MLNKAVKLFRRFETLLIVLLLISAVYLLLRAMTVNMSDYVDKLFPGGQDQDVGSLVNTGGIVPSSPFAIVLTDGNGSHIAAKYENETRQRVFAMFSATLGEALGSSGEAGAIKESDWLEALKKQSVFFDYLRPIPLQVLSLHLGAELPAHTDDDISVRRLILGEHEGNLCLYLKDETSGAYYRMDTALSFSSLNLEQRINDLSPNWGSFAFEHQKDFPKLEPCFVFSEEDMSLTPLSSGLPFIGPEYGSLSLDTFGMKEGAASIYSEQDGSMVYVEGGKSLRVSSSGFMLFSVTGTGGIPVVGSGEATVTDCVYAAGRLVRQTVATSCGDAELGIMDIEQGERDGSCTVTFGYYVNGIPVSLQNTGWCARVRISGGNIVRAEFYYRTYVLQTGDLAPLPERQAAILAAYDGGEPLLIYEDNSEGIGWSWILN